MPIGSSYNTELSQVQAASTHVTDVSQQIQSQLQNLNNQIEPLFDAWKGSAAQSYQALHQQWMADAQKINQVLGQIAEGLMQNYNQYTNAEQDNAGLMTQQAGQLSA